jgi:hypothetical protein
VNHAQDARATRKALMKKKFSGELLSGHKQDAVEVPFDPGSQWGLQPQPLRPGRRGYPVKATINGHRFESAIVPRQKRWFLLIDVEVARAAGVRVTDTVKVTVEPS